MHRGTAQVKHGVWAAAGHAGLGVNACCPARACRRPVHAGMHSMQRCRLACCETLPSPLLPLAGAVGNRPTEGGTAMSVGGAWRGRRPAPARVCSCVWQCGGRFGDVGAAPSVYDIKGQLQPLEARSLCPAERATCDAPRPAGTPGVGNLPPGGASRLSSGEGKPSCPAALLHCTRGLPCLPGMRHCARQSQQHV